MIASRDQATERRGGSRRGTRIEVQEQRGLDHLDLEDDRTVVSPQQIDADVRSVWQPHGDGVADGSLRGRCLMRFAGFVAEYVAIQPGAVTQHHSSAVGVTELPPR